MGTATDVSRPHDGSEYSFSVRAVPLGSDDTEDPEALLQFRYGPKRSDFGLGLQWHHIEGQGGSSFYFVSPTLLFLFGEYDGEEEFAITPGIGFGTAIVTPIDRRQSRHTYFRADISQSLVLYGDWAPPQFMLSVGFRYVDNVIGNCL